MAFAAVAAEHVLEVSLLEHLNRTNSTLASGSQRRADLYRIDRAGNRHVVEAKSRTYGFSQRDVSSAKAQACNVRIVGPRGRSVTPATRSASLTDLSTTPVSVLLADPEGETETGVTYMVDPARLIQVHYSAVRDLLEVRGESQPPPATEVGAAAIGAFLPGTDLWLGVRESLLKPTLASWGAYSRFDEASDLDIDRDDERVSRGPDGHVLQVGAELARTFEWTEAAGSMRERDHLAARPCLGDVRDELVARWERGCPLCFDKAIPIEGKSKLAD
jgi:hypothetical protein